MLALAVPVAPHLHATEFIGEDFLAGRADDDGRLRPEDGWPWGGELRAEDDLFTHAGEGVVVARPMTVEVVVVAFAFDAHQQELAIVGRALIVVITVQLVKVKWRSVHSRCRDR